MPLSGPGVSSVPYQLECNSFGDEKSVIAHDGSIRGVGHLPQTNSRH